jgi:hypothetical protein
VLSEGAALAANADDDATLPMEDTDTPDNSAADPAPAPKPQPAPAVPSRPFSVLANTNANIPKPAGSLAVAKQAAAPTPEAPAAWEQKKSTKMASLFAKAKSVV